MTYLDVRKHPNLKASLGSRESPMHQAWNGLSAECVEGMAVILPSRWASPSAQLITMSSTSIKSLILHKHRKHRDSTYLDTNTPTQPSPDVCCLRKQKSAAEEADISPETNQISVINRLYLPSCTVTLPGAVHGGLRLGTPGS